MDLWPLACWNCGFESLRGHGYLSLVSVVCHSVAARFKTWICGHSLVGIAGSNPSVGTDICLWWVLCVIQSNHPSRGVPQRVASLSVIVKPRQWRGCGPLGAVMPIRTKQRSLCMWTCIVLTYEYTGSLSSCIFIHKRMRVCHKRLTARDVVLTFS